MSHAIPIENVHTLWLLCIDHIVHWPDDMSQVSSYIPIETLQLMWFILPSMVSMLVLVHVFIVLWHTSSSLQFSWYSPTSSLIT